MTKNTKNFPEVNPKQSINTKHFLEEQISDQWNYEAFKRLTQK